MDDSPADVSITSQNKHNLEKKLTIYGQHV